MKKLVTLVIFVIALCTFSNAQNYLELNVTQFNHGTFYPYCATIDSIIINQDGTCQDTANWEVGDYINGTTFFEGYANHVTITSEMGYNILIHYSDCHGTKWFAIDFIGFENIPEPWTEDTRWLAPGETLELDAYYSENLSYLWQDNSTDWRYFVTGPETSGKIWVRMYNDCGELSDTINVYYGEGVYRATVDLETNLNKVTWQTTPKQTEYISEVKVYRDGMLVGTVPYEQGYFLDNIGSDNAARNYHLVSVTPNGEESPASAQKGTIHTTYYQDVNNNLNMTWNIPYVQQGAQGTLTYFQICKYDPNTGEITVVDQVNASITDYTCGVNQFDGGYAVIAAVFNDGKGMEELSFSNLTTDILGIEEDGPSTGSGTFTVYPNPAKDRVTIEGTGTIIVTNALGQTILTKEIDGKETIELPRGMCFVKMNGVTWKIEVE